MGASGVGLLVLDADARRVGLDPAPDIPTAPPLSGRRVPAQAVTYTTTVPPTDRCDKPSDIVGSWKDANVGDALKDSAITASSYHPDTPASDTKLSRLGSPKAWCAESDNASQWIQWKFETLANVTAVHLEGRKDQDSFVTSFQINYTDKLYPNMSDWLSFRAGMTLDGNAFHNQAIFHTLNPPFLAQQVRIMPQDWHTHVCLRALFEGCKGDDVSAKLVVQVPADATVEATNVAVKKAVEATGRKVKVDNRNPNATIQGTNISVTNLSMDVLKTGQGVPSEIKCNETSENCINGVKALTVKETQTVTNKRFALWSELLIGDILNKIMIILAAFISYRVVSAQVSQWRQSSAMELAQEQLGMPKISET